MGNSSVNRTDPNTVAQRQPSAPLFSEQTRQAIVNTLITVLAAAAFAAAASGVYLLAQHNYALLSGFENTVGLVVTSSYVLLASGLTLCIINYSNKEAPKKLAPLTGQPVVTAALAAAQPTAEKTTYPLPNVASLKSPDDKQLKHLAKKLKEGEYCEIRSPINLPVILVRDRLFVFDERGSNCSIFDINTSALPSDPNLPDYTAVRTLLKDYRDVTADVGARLEDFPFVLEVETARELCPFIGPNEYTTYALPDGEKRETHAGGYYVNHFANNGKEDMYYTPANRLWGQKSFIDLLAEVRSSGFTFVSHATLRARGKAQKASAGAHKGSGVASSAIAPASAKDPAASPAPAPAPAPAASAPPSGAPTSAPVPAPASSSSAAAPAPASPPSPPQPPAQPFVAPAPAPAPAQAPASATAAAPMSAAPVPAASQSGPTYHTMTQPVQDFMAARLQPCTYFFSEVGGQKRIIVRNERNQLMPYTDLSKLSTLGPSFKEVSFSDLQHKLLEGELSRLRDSLGLGEYVVAHISFYGMSTLLCTKAADGKRGTYYYNTQGAEFVVDPTGGYLVPQQHNLNHALEFYRDPAKRWTERSVAAVLLGLPS